MHHLFRKARNRYLLVVAVVVAMVAAVMVPMIISAATTTSQNLAAGDTLNVHCLGPSLHVTQSGLVDASLVCDPNPTTTTTAPPSPPTEVASSSATTASGVSSITVPKPTGTLAGDIVLVGINTTDDGFDIAAPSGWTVVDRTTPNGLSGDMRLQTFSHVVASTDGTSYNFPFGGASTGPNIAGAVTIHNALNVGAHAAGTDSTGPLLDTATIAPASTSLTVSFISQDQSGTAQSYTPATGWTEHLDAFENANEGTVQIESKVAGATGEATYTGNGTSARQGFTSVIEMKAVTIPPGTTTTSTTTTTTTVAPTTTTQPASGKFTVGLDGILRNPSNVPFKPNGANVGTTCAFDHTGVANGHSTEAQSTWNWSAIRLNASWDAPQTWCGGTPQDMTNAVQSVINEWTAKSIVVIVASHDLTLFGDQNASLNGMAAVAAANKTNPYVWYNCYNEPPYGGANYDTQQKACIDTVRGQGATAPIVMDGQNSANDASWDGVNSPTDGGMAQHCGVLKPYDPQHNIIMSMHNYGGHLTSGDLASWIDAVHGAGCSMVIGEFGYSYIYQGSCGAGDYNTNYSAAAANFAAAPSRNVGLIVWHGTMDDSCALRSDGGSYYGTAALSDLGSKVYALTH